MKRAEFSRVTRRDALSRSGKRCEASGPRYGLPEGKRCNCDLSYGVEFDHDLPDVLGGDNSLDNCRAICVRCHKHKTKGDIRQTRKADRQRDKNNGTFPKPIGNARIQSRGFSSSRIWRPIETQEHDHD